jgi:hypothetical protein
MILLGIITKRKSCNQMKNASNISFHHINKYIDFQHVMYRFEQSSNNRKILNSRSIKLFITIKFY